MILYNINGFNTDLILINIIDWQQYNEQKRDKR